jgi:hypothetical protein
MLRMRIMHNIVLCTSRTDSAYVPEGVSLSELSDVSDVRIDIRAGCLPSRVGLRMSMEVVV